MGVDLREYSRSRIGQVWSEMDHQLLEHALTRIDETCAAVWDKIRQECAQDRPANASNDQVSQQFFQCPE